MKALSILTFAVNAGPRHSPKSLSQRKSGFDYREVHVGLTAEQRRWKRGFSKHFYS